MRNTENAVSAIKVLRITKELTKNAFFYQGPMIWNKLPMHDKESTSLNSFKCNYKKALFQKYTTSHWVFVHAY